jgi:hypothetical protein
LLKTASSASRNRHAGRDICGQAATRTVEVALQRAGMPQFQGRAADFVGWAKRG